MADRLALVFEAEPVVGIGDRLDVVGLQLVIDIDIVGVLADQRTDDVHGIDAVGRRDLSDLGPECAVPGDQIADLVVFPAE